MPCHRCDCRYKSINAGCCWYWEKCNSISCAWNLVISWTVPDPTAIIISTSPISSNPFSPFLHHVHWHEDYQIQYDLFKSWNQCFYLFTSCFISILITDHNQWFFISTLVFLRFLATDWLHRCRWWYHRQRSRVFFRNYMVLNWFTSIFIPITPSTSFAASFVCLTIKICYDLCILCLKDEECYCVYCNCDSNK